MNRGFSSPVIADLDRLAKKLRQARAALNRRSEQLAAMTNVARSHADDAEALREVLRTMRALVRSKRWEALEAMSKEWAG